MSTQYKVSKDVPTSVLVERLRELSKIVCLNEREQHNELTMRIPAEVDRDADLVIAEAAHRLETLLQGPEFEDGPWAKGWYQRVGGVAPSIMLVGGNYFDLTEPELGSISIEQIAHSLSCNGRFAGHTKRFYSVAQHSVLVSLMVPQEYALHALLHDAGEAIYGDISSPLKRILADNWSGFKAFLNRIDVAIWARFGLPAIEPEEVRKADLLALALEKRDLMPWDDGSVTWKLLDGITPPECYHVLASPPDYAEQLFLERYEQIKRGETNAYQNPELTRV